MPLFQEKNEIKWDESQMKVISLRQWRYGSLILSEDESNAVNDSQARILFENKAEFMLEKWLQSEAMRMLINRICFAARQQTTLNRRPQDFLRQLMQVGGDTLNIKPLLDQDQNYWISLLFSVQEQESLRREAPLELQLPSGRKLKIHYEADQPPWVESRIQDFFGMAETPVIGSGSMALVVHLLAPNRRPIQITRDLHSFFTGEYQKLRRQLSTRYRRHAWPENPFEKI